MSDNNVTQSAASADQSIEQIIDGLGRYAEAGATDLRVGIAAPDDAHRQQTLDALEEWVS